MTWAAPGRITQILVLITSIGMQAQTAPPKPPPPAVPTVRVQMAAGAARLDKKVDAKTAKPGDPVTAKLMDDIQCSDGVLLPKDATLAGRVVEVQPSENKGDSKLVLIFDVLIPKGKPPIRVKVTMLGLVSPPVQGPDTKTGNRDSDLEGVPPAVGKTRGGPLRNNPVMHDQPSHEKGDTKDSTVPGVSLDASIQDPNSGTIGSKGKNAQLPIWTQMRIAIIDLPPNAALK
jgi:hypothetical protein